MSKDIEHPQNWPLLVIKTGFIGECCASLAGGTMRRKVAYTKAGTADALWKGEPVSTFLTSARSTGGAGP